MREYARIIIIAIVALCLSACKSIKYVPVETIKIDTTYISQIKIDSIYHRDSIYIEHKGDTVYLSKYKYLYKYIEKHDTLWRERTDTIQIAYPVEAQLSKWQKIKMQLGNTFIGICIIALIVCCALFIIKQKQYKQ